MSDMLAIVSDRDRDNLSRSESVWNDAFFGVSNGEFSTSVVMVS